MATEFNRIITLLRKERGITQKQAAQDLGISQAQLSHYEKGIRECSLKFVVQIADYYDVSCDYLLGRSAERSGRTIRVEELPDGNLPASGSHFRGSVLPAMYKKLIANSLDILYDKLAACKEKQLTATVSEYLMLSVYKMFRLLYQAAPRNVSNLFRVDAVRWEQDASAAQHLSEGALHAVLQQADASGKDWDPAALCMSTESLSDEYPRRAASLFTLIKNTEESIHRLQDLRES